MDQDVAAAQEQHGLLFPVHGYCFGISYSCGIFSPSLQTTRMARFSILTLASQRHGSSRVVEKLRSLPVWACRKPLPYLFMRFTIQANAASRELRGFVLDILSMLMGQAVWADTHQWQGWIVCVQQLLPDSLPLLLQVKSPFVVFNVKDGFKCAEE